MSFWDNVFQAPPQPTGHQPVVPQATPWWRNDDPYGQMQTPQVRTDQVQQYETGLTEREIQQVRKRGHSQVNAEQAEAIAEYDLTHKAKYQNRCPECDSGNFIPAGTRVQAAGVGVMPTDKCFDCGYSARGPERAVGASSSGGSSIHTRQIDTGGHAGSSMYMKFTGVPRSYVPRT